MGGRIRAACVAYRSNHAVQWPDTHKFSDREDLGHRVGPLTPNEAFPPRCDPSNFKWVTLGGDSVRFADQSAILEGGCPVAVPSGAGAKTAQASFLLNAGHAQRLGAEALREILGEGRPDHVCEGLHSEFQHMWSSGLHTCVGFGRRQSNNAKKHVYAVVRKVRPSSPALAQHEVFLELQTTFSWEWRGGNVSSRTDSRPQINLGSKPIQPKDPSLNLRCPISPPRRTA